MSRKLPIPTHGRPTTPGEIAKRIRVSYPRLSEIIHGRRGVSPDTALRLAKVTGMSPGF